MVKIVVFLILLVQKALQPFSKNKKPKKKKKKKKKKALQVTAK